MCECIYVYIALPRPVRVSLSVSCALRGGGQRLVAARHKIFPLNSVFGKLEKFYVYILLFHSNDLNECIARVKEIYSTSPQRKKSFHSSFAICTTRTISIGMIRNRFWYDIYEALSVWLCHCSAKHFLTKAITVRSHSLHTCFRQFHATKHSIGLLLNLLSSKLHFNNLPILIIFF